MKFFDSLRGIKPELGKRSAAALWLTVATSVLLATVSSNSGAQTLVEEVDLPKPVVLQTGVPIPSLNEAAKQTIVDSSGQQSDEELSILEYELGANTVREFRDGDRLLYVEVTNTVGSTYVVDYRISIEQKNQKPRSGVVVSSW